MKIMTRDFGEMEVEQEAILQFAAPIYGFENLRDYVMITDEDNPHIVWLQSVESPEICFILVDPALLGRTYAPPLPKNLPDLLDEGEYLFWLVMVVKDDIHQSTVNLRSPIVVNPENRKAAQIVLDMDYPIRYPLIGGKGWPGC